MADVVINVGAVSAITAGTGLTGGTITGTGTVSADFGTSAGTVCQGNDSRLTNTRTPAAHASTHAASGTDPITLSQAQITNLSTDLAAKVAGTRQVIAGTGMGGGGALSADVTLNVSYGTSGTTACVGNDARLSNARTPSTHASTHGAAGSDAITIAQSQVTSLVSDLSAKALGTTTITAGTGLTGGGDLSTNRTITANFGTTAGTICQGNDARFSSINPGGSITQVQFNNGGTFAGDAGLTYNSTTDALTVAGDSFINGVRVGRGTSSNLLSTAVGVQALGLATNGANNTAVGYFAGQNLVGGDANTLLGYRAGLNITGVSGSSGFDNTLIGANAGFSLVTGTTNTLIGSSAGVNLTSDDSTMIGYIAGLNTTTGSQNVFIGSRSGRFSTTGFGNAAVGNDALRGTSTALPFRGNASTAIGASALLNAMPSVASHSNTAVGYQAGLDISTGRYNVAVGNQALVSNMIGDNNTALGEYAGDGCKQSNNVYVGQLTAYRNWFGTSNVMIGQQAGGGNNSISNQKDEFPNESPSTVTSNTSPYNASENTVVGFEAFRHPKDTTGQSAGAVVTMTQTVTSPGTAIVVTQASHGLSTGNPVAFRSTSVNPAAAGNADVSLTLLPSPLFSGRTYYAIVDSASIYRLAESPDEASGSGFTPVTPILCTAATGAGTYNRWPVGTTTANGNTIMGYRAGLAGAGASQFSGTYNSLFGHQAGLVMTSGSNNVCMGRNAGDALTTGSTNICIGYNTDVDSATGSSQINIGGTYFHNRLITTPLTLAQLNALPGLTEGMRGFCTDATATTFASTITGGSTNNVPCYYDGAWKIG